MNQPSAIQPGSSLARYVWKLLRLRWVIYFSGFLRAKPARKVGYVVIWLLLLGLFVGAFVLSWLLLRALQSPQVAVYVDLRSLRDGLPVLALGGAFVGILLTSFGVLLQALYLSGDIDFLLAAPVPIRAVFIAKLVQAILPNLGLISLLGLPLLFGLGAASGYNVLYYPLLVLILIALALAAAGLAALLVMGVVRLFPARRVAEVLGFFGGILSLICSQAGQWGRFVDVSESQALQATQTLARFNTPWLPLAWPGRGLVALGTGQWGTGLLLTGLTLVLSGGAFALALTTAERLYYTGWARLQVGTQKKRPARVSRPATAEHWPWLVILAERLLPAPVRGIVVKDLLVLRRDLRNLSQLISSLILAFIYVLAIGRGTDVPGGRGEAPAIFMQSLHYLKTYSALMLWIFMSWSLISRLALMGFSQEGKQYWLLKSAPLSIGNLLLAKYLVAYLPTLGLSGLFLLVISVLHGNPGDMLLYGLPVIALSSAGTTGINLAFGVLGAKLDWDDPRRMVSGNSGCLGALASMAYLVLSLGLFFGPPLGLTLLKQSTLLGQALGLILGGVLGVACALIPPWLVRQRVSHIGEV